MRFGSVCSGIEAASVAWHPLGWSAAWFSEIEPFPCAALAHHYPAVPNHGDMTTLPDRILSGEVEAPDVFCGGTPCQAFSVAGNRQSLDDARGNLSLTFCEIANAIDNVRHHAGQPPAIVFWENVPGVLNTKDNAFGCFLAGLAGEELPLQPPGGRWTDAGVVHGPQRTVAWRVLDAQYFGLAQRRKRVFVVASAREGFNPAEVLFEFDGLRRDTPPSREARQGAAADAESGAWWDGGQVAATLTVEGAGGNQRMPDKGNLGAVVVPHPVCAEISPTVTNGPPFSRTGNERVECDALVTYGIPGNWIGRAPENGGNATTPMDNVAPCLTSTDRHGAATIAPPHAFKIRGGCEGGGKGYLGMDEQVFTITTGHDQQVAVPIAFEPGIAKREGGDNRFIENLTPTLRAGAGDNQIAAAYPINTLTLGGRPDPVNDARMTLGVGADGDPQFTLQAAHCHAVATAVPFTFGIDEECNVGNNLFGPLLRGGQGGTRQAVATQYAVRRLTPVECERLQGFPDNYTNIPWRNKPEAPDGPRYKALGNSWAVPVVRWIGRRIQAAL